MFTLLLFPLIPLIGLAIDQSMIWIVRAKLQTAVDGAALGAGRLLGTNANTTEIAGEYLKANFTVGYWSTYNLVSDITYTRTFATNTIVVRAKVDLPLLFMRIIGANHVTVPASGTATRKDTRVVLVLDRSYSMHDLLADLKSYSKQFVSMFTPGVDQLGLVVFGTSAIVGYPQYAGTRPYSYTISSTNVGGPDDDFATVGSSPMSGPMITVLNSLVVGGNTGMADALALAYIELQKAHMIDAAANGGVDDRLNSIVFFTDGVPNTIAAYLNDPNSNSLKPFGNLNGQSRCTYAPDNSVYANQIRANGGVPAADTKMIGSLGQSISWIAQLASTDTYYDAANNPVWTLWWVQHPGSQNGHISAPGDYDTSYTPLLGTKPFTSCNGLPSGLGDLARIPAKDLYGTSTDGGEYTHSTVSAVCCGPGYTSSGYNDAHQVTLASWNATDNVGLKIRTDANLANRAGDTTNLNIAIYVIGYQGNGGTDAGLLKRLANTQDSSSYVSTQPSGLYVEASDTTALAQAFQTVASELLRLAK